MNIILVEGMDGAGKTTLISRLMHLGGIVVSAHLTYKDAQDQPNAILRYTNLFEFHASCGVDTLILDRGWYSDIVYGLVLRDKPDVSYGELRAIERAAIGYGDLTIFFVMTAVDTAWKRCKERGEDLIKDKATLKLISGSYLKEIRCAKEHSPALIYEVRT